MDNWTLLLVVLRSLRTLIQIGVAFWQLFEIYKRYKKRPPSLRP